MSASMDDYPLDRHLILCAVWTSDAPCSCGADSVGRLADRFGEGFADSRPDYPLDDPLTPLLRPDAGSLADRLEQLARTLPSEGEAS